ncbi:hypothetical protein RN001_016441 [Aquatica leii]|uniref:Secreted protein n=1 Tax=Aquatica leii TaxID=1421715 RepID=A0AAN7PP78_9COLE|nr:hypothetical protein RN001_016441 [Aquatica leii]
MHFKILVIALVCNCVYAASLSENSLVHRRVVREPKVLRYLFDKLWGAHENKVCSEASASAASTGSYQSEAHSQSATFAFGPFSASFSRSRASSKGG